MSEEEKFIELPVEVIEYPKTKVFLTMAGVGFKLNGEEGSCCPGVGGAAWIIQWRGKTYQITAQAMVHALLEHLGEKPDAPGD